MTAAANTAPNSRQAWIAAKTATPFAAACLYPGCCTRKIERPAGQRGKPKQGYCSDACRRAHSNLILRRGAQLYRLCMRWRKDGRTSHSKGEKVKNAGAYGDVTAYLDMCIREDKEMRAAALAAKGRAA